MDARRWHQQACAASPSWPPPLQPDQLQAVSASTLASYSTSLRKALAVTPLPSDVVDSVHRQLDAVLAHNDAGRAGSKSIVAVDGPFTAGKSTLIKQWGQTCHRQWVTSGDRPCWTPRPGLTADLVPVVYITLIAGSRVKELNAQLLTFLGYPAEGLARVTTTRVVTALATHGVRLLVLDDAHMMRTTSITGRETLDYVKFLNSELGELGGTLVLVGADLSHGPILSDPQIQGRLELITMRAPSNDTAAGRLAWQRQLAHAERLVLPYLPTAEPGLLTRTLAGRVWRRTQGYLGDTAALITHATINALSARQTTITAEHLDVVRLSDRAQQAEAHLIATHHPSEPTTGTPSKPPSSRRPSGGTTRRAPTTTRATNAA